jgi:hypothetical protein
MTSLVDNDIVLKASCYGLVNQLLVPSCGSLKAAGVLGAARFVVSHRITKKRLDGGPTEALQHLATLLDLVSTVEPTSEEQAMAADFELAAQRAGVNLDTGESHLCALAVSRQIPKFLTGDKRAVAAIEVLLDLDARLSYLCGRVFCLEQLTRHAIESEPDGLVRAAICKQPTVDKTLTICSGCHAEATEAVVLECLDSYLGDLREKAARVLSA